MKAHAWKITGVIGLVAGLLLLWWDTPAVHDLIWIVTMGMAALATVWGIYLHRPRRSRTWWLLALSMSLFVAGIVAAPSALALTADEPRRMAGEVLGLLGYIVLGVAARRFVGYQTPKRDRDGLIDALIVMVALTTVLWTIVFGGGPIDEMPLASGVALAAALLVPVWVAALSIRLILTSGARLLSARLLGTGGLTLFVVTLLWVLSDFAGIAIPTAASDLLWLLAIVMVPATALHPSMRELTEPAPEAQDAVSVGRLTVLGLALIAVPAALLQAAGSVEVNILLPVGGSALLAVFVLARLARLVSERERARREVTVRAIHQEALSKLAADALSNHDTTELYDDAQELLRAAVDDAEVRVHTASGCAPPDTSGPHHLRLLVTGMDGPVAVIEVIPTAGVPLDHEARQFLHAVADVLSSATQRRQVEVELEHRATHDPLTGLPNRVHLFDRLEQALLRRGDQHVGILYIDLDGFKPVNDTYGHEAGDLVLVTLAERMRGFVRAADTVARLAGDEFVAIIDPSTPGELTVVAERLIELIAGPIDINGVTITMAASIGAVVSTPADRYPEALLRRADEAMYAAKQDPDLAVVVANGS